MKWYPTTHSYLTNLTEEIDRLILFLNKNILKPTTKPAKTVKKSAKTVKKTAASKTKSLSTKFKAQPAVKQKQIKIKKNIEDIVDELTELKNDTINLKIDKPTAKFQKLFRETKQLLVQYEKTQLERENKELVSNLLTKLDEPYQYKMKLNQTPKYRNGVLEDGIKFYGYISNEYLGCTFSDHAGMLFTNSMYGHRFTGSEYKIYFHALRANPSEEALPSEAGSSKAISVCQELFKNGHYPEIIVLGEIGEGEGSKEAFAKRYNNIKNYLTQGGLCGEHAKYIESNINFVATAKVVRKMCYFYRADVVQIFSGAWYNHTDQKLAHMKEGIPATYSFDNVEFVHIPNEGGILGRTQAIQRLINDVWPKIIAGDTNLGDKNPEFKGYKEISDSSMRAIENSEQFIPGLEGKRHDRVYVADRMAATAAAYRNRHILGAGATALSTYGLINLLL